MVKTQSSHHVVETELIVDHQRPKDYHSMLRLLSLIQPSVAGFGMLVNRSKNDRTSAIIHSLPNEILLEIFRECIPKTAQDRSIRNASQAPLLLGRVCRLWRLLSLSSSALWSNLTIVWTEDDRKKDLKATKVWLLRSESHPLTIHVDVARARCHSPRFSKVLVLVAAQASRWKEISIARLPHQYHNILLAPLSMAVGFPYLESFHVQILTDIFFEPGLVPEVIDVSFDLSSAPRLLEFTHYGGWGFHLDFRTQIHTMRSLRIVYEAPLGMPYSLEELLSVLIQCTSLEELLLPIRKDPSSNHPAQRHLIPIVTLPNLHELTLIMDRGTHPGYIVERLSVPELTTLDIRFDTYVDEEDVDQDLTEWPHLLPLLERPHLISELYLRVAMTQANLMQCLPLIPSLEILGFSGINCSDTILQFLTMDHSNPSANVCQKLHTISFTLQGDDEFSSNSMTAMILSRLYGDQFPSASERSPLRVICCDDFDFDNISNNPDIAACMEDGLLLVNELEDCRLSRWWP